MTSRRGGGHRAWKFVHFRDGDPTGPQASVIPDAPVSYLLVAGPWQPPFGAVCPHLLRCFGESGPSRDPKRQIFLFALGSREVLRLMRRQVRMGVYSVAEIQVLHI